MTPERDDRYQFQPRHVRVYRWFRWRPWYMVSGSLCVGLWILIGMPIDPRERPWFPTRWSYAVHLWKMNRSMADVRMRRTWTTKEIREHLREFRGRVG